MKEKLHTADHILFTVLEKKFPVKTKAMQFSEDSCRVDYECETDLRLIKEELEKEVNEIIQEGHKINSYDLPRDEAAKICDVSLIPDSIKTIKIYEITDVNKIACGGPHVNNTKDVGKFEIIKIKKKGKNYYSIKYTVK